jgi:hypothetical protein
MRLTFGLAWIGLAYAVFGAESAWAQVDYSGKMVYGMFGPRVLGETLQSPVRRADRGIARDAYGVFVGINRSYSGRRFPEANPRAAAKEPAPVPPAPEALPETQPAPDEWLRTEGSGANIAPSPWSIEADLPDSSSLHGPRRTPYHVGGTAVLVGLPSDSPASDPFSRRIAAVLEKTARIKTLAPIRVVVVHETAILRGRVATSQDRELAENLVRLEPGIWSVKNELVVEETSRIAVNGTRPTGTP